ncbi:MAG: tripartite tricarboxylate transporter family receptor [Rhodospirillales bacterium]|jgi:tripartite-type tricarboxylate transporter receptor subunit TctC|nr:tripartite tricarboxylate transporter family receptor [Rhodospirillales bacterium]
MKRNGWAPSLALAASVITAGLLAFTENAGAQSVADFYKGKNLEVYVGYGPGGGYDQYGRLLARHIGKHLPGNPGTIVRNMPGAGSAKLAGYMHEVAPKDGLQIGIIASTVAFDPLLGSEGGENSVRFDPRELNWLGSLDAFTPIGVSWHTSGIKTIEDAKRKEVLVGSSGTGDSSAVYPKLLNGMIGTKFKVLAGYKGSNDITLAMERGELPAFVGWYWYGLKTTKGNWLKDKTANLFLQIGPDPEPEMQGVPWVMDILPTEADKQVFRVVLANLAFSRPFVAPPGVPEDRLAALAKAIEATSKDPDFLSEAEKQTMSVKYYSRERIAALLKDVYATPPELIKKVKDAMVQ